jgi:glycosyltransferase involved in cell wall biosynthesis
MTKTILVKGPALSQTGYGEQTRFAVRSLLSRPDLFDVFLQPTEWGKSSWLLPNDSDRKWIDQLIRKTVVYTQQGGTFQVSLQVTIPNEWEKLAPVNIGYTAGIETTKVAPNWIEKSRLMNKIITISNHSRDVYLNTVYDAKMEGSDEVFKVRCETPIEVVHYPIRSYDPADVNITLENDFNFLCVAQWGPRKNLDNTIRWWLEEFKDEEVGLVLKTNLIKNSVIDREVTESRLRNLLATVPDRKCKVYLLHGYMTPQEMTALYQHPKIKCLVSLTHGEGFGLPLFEAAYNELPVIAPSWSGHTDFLSAPRKVRRNKKTVTKTVECYAPVKYDLKNVQPEQVWDGVIQADSKWCYPTSDSYKKQLRNVYNNINRFNKMATDLKTHIEKTFTPQGQHNQMAEAIAQGCGVVPTPLKVVSFD